MVDVKYYNVDSLSYLKTIPDNSIPLVITDPPYGINFHSQNDPDTGWDKFNENEFEDFLRQWLTEVYRILTPTGTLWMFFAPTTVNTVFKVVDDVGFTNHLENWAVLARAKGRGASKKLKSVREDVLHLTKDPKKYTWHSVEYLREVIAPYTKDGKPRGWALDESTGQRVRWTGVGNVMFYTMPYYLGVGERQIHSCQKPLLLWARLIMQSSDIGETVLDPFMGSGSSGISAIMCERNFIGCEIDKDMFDKASNWIEEFKDPNSRTSEKLEEYFKKHVSSNEKGFKFNFEKRLILPKEI